MEQIDLLYRESSSTFFFVVSKTSPIDKYTIFFFSIVIGSEAYRKKLIEEGATTASDEKDVRPLP